MSKKPLYCSSCGSRLVDDECAKCRGVNKPLSILRLHDIPIDDKVKAFNKFYEMSLYHARGHFGEDSRCDCDCDCKHYIFEEVVGRCLGKGIFAQLNENFCYSWPEDVEVDYP